MSLITVFIIIGVLYLAKNYYSSNKTNASRHGRTNFYHKRKNFYPKNSFNIGQKFEDYVENVLFPDRDFILVEKTHSHKTNSNRYVESSMKPDFTFRSRADYREFYVEAKYRSEAKEVVQWCENYQFRRYKAYNYSKQVFIAIGIGGVPSQPDYIFVISLDKLNYNTFRPSDYQNNMCKINEQIPVSR